MMQHNKCWRCSFFSCWSPAPFFPHSCRTPWATCTPSLGAQCHPWYGRGTPPSSILRMVSDLKVCLHPSRSTLGFWWIEPELKITTWWSQQNHIICKKQRPNLTSWALSTPRNAYSKVFENNLCNRPFLVKCKPHFRNDFFQNTRIIKRHSWMPPSSLQNTCGLFEQTPTLPWGICWGVG